MSNKDPNHLNAIDRDLRKAIPICGWHGSTVVQLTIEKICGFEKFNTRPYHNYETWADGWRISDGITTVEREDLDDAVREWISQHSQE